MEEGQGVDLSALGWDLGVQAVDLSSLGGDQAVDLAALADDQEVREVALAALVEDPEDHPLVVLEEDQGVHLSALLGVQETSQEDLKVDLGVGLYKLDEEVQEVGVFALDAHEVDQVVQISIAARTHQ